MNRTAPTLLPLALLAALMMTAACGGGGGGSSASPTDNNAVADAGPDDASEGDTSDDANADDASEGDAAGDVDDEPDVPFDPRARVRFDPASEDYFALAMPSDVRLDDEGRPDFDRWPVASDNFLLSLWYDAGVDLMEGWGLISGAFTWFSAPIDVETLPQSVEATLDAEDWPSVALVDVDPESPQVGQLLPLNCRFTEPAGTIHAAYQLACYSPWGVVRRPNTTYAFVITDALQDTTGAPVMPSEPMSQLLAGQSLTDRQGRTVDPARWSAARDVLVEAGMEEGSLVSLHLFTTGNPAERLRRIGAWYDTLPTPTLAEDVPPQVVQTFEDYVVIEAAVEMPVIQEGERPYTLPPSGRIVFGEDGQPVVQSTQQVRVFFSIPRQPMPEGGFPVLTFMHGSGGKAEQLWTRGPQPDPPPGSGPAGVVAPYGVAGFSSDFPLHGKRHSPPDTTGLLLYNLINNPRATVDNFIIAGCELTLHARMLSELTLDPAIAPDVLDAGDAEDGLIRFNGGRLTLMGQSMGSTIGLPALTVDKTTSAGIMSGSGGSLIEIASTSTQPVNVANLMEPLLDYRNDEEIDQFDPALHAMQHVWDYVDTLVHARHVAAEPHEGVPPKHILQHSGLTDGYFSPESRAGLAAALELDLVEPVEEPLALEIMGLVGHGEPIAVPASGNGPAGTTAVSAQYQPSVLDGHNVAYQRDDAKAQYACFARSVGAEDPPVFRPAADATLEACEAPR